jgi:exosortase D (VPLPA-CTERM-specific)
MWKRVFLFLSTIPITVFMNSFRIGVIGITVEYWGISMAEGFLHDFEGWVIFMACTGVLALEMWILASIGKDHRPLREVFGLVFPQHAPEDAQIKYRKLPKPFWGGILLLLMTSAVALSLPNRLEIEQPREQFFHFPLNVERWSGDGERLPTDVIDALKFDDYVMVNYKNASNESVNFYVAYYASQRKGESAHSPRSCIPGGGWQITELDTVSVDGVTVNNNPLRANRVVIRKGDYTQIVYYWFQQRGRVITNEYLVKWYLFWDALTANRSDGALVRLSTLIEDGQDISEGDDVLTQFAADVVPRLGSYIPN